MPTYQALVDRGDKAGAIDGATLLKERRERIVGIQDLTGRPLIVYFSNFIKGGNIPGNSIDDSDLTAFSDLIENVPGDAIDVMLHTPGGLAEAAERIVALLRSRFKLVRFLVPHTAYSAGTLVAFSGDEILMDDRSALGPVDPQIMFRDPMTGEVSFVPSQTITLGFERAIGTLKDAPAEVLKAYLPMLNKLNLHLFEICKNAEELSRSLSIDFLTRYMFHGDPAEAGKVEDIAKFFTRHDKTMSHRRGIHVEKAKELGLKVFDLRSEPKLRDAIWQLHCAVEFFVDASGDTAKFFENAYGVSWRRRFQTVAMQIQAPAPQPQRPGGGKR